MKRLLAATSFAVLSLTPSIVVSKTIYVMRPPSALGKRSIVLPNNAFGSEIAETPSTPETPTTPTTPETPTTPTDSDGFHWRSQGYPNRNLPKTVKVSQSKTDMFSFVLDAAGRQGRLPSSDGRDMCYLQKSTTSSDRYGSSYMEAGIAGGGTLIIHFKKAGKFAVIASCNYQGGSMFWSRQFEFTITE